MSTLPIDELRYQLWCMEQAFVPADHKLRAVHALLQGGTLALSLLISRLAQPSDPLFLKETLIPTGPLNPGPPRKMCVTLKYQIETILYEILCPVNCQNRNYSGRSQPDHSIQTCSRVIRRLSKPWLR